MNLLFDTCILHYLSDKSIENSIKTYTQELTKRHFIATISDYTCYELLQGAPVLREQKLISILEQFDVYPVERRILISSAQLQTLYNMEKIPHQQISDGDKIIAATSIITKSPIITANVNDFPRPFFIELEQRKLEYTKKDKPHMIPVYILEPDLPLITQRFLSRPH